MRTQGRAKGFVGAAAAAALTFVGCGGGQTQGAAFDGSWSNDNGAGIGAFQQRFASTTVPVGADVAVGVSGGQTLVGLPLDGGSPWTYDHALDARPTAVGTVVVGMGHGELFALDARTGKPLWKRNAGGRLRGAGDDGKTTVVSLMETTGQGSIVLAIDHDGQMIRQIEDGASIGVPAVVGHYAFLPWQNQYVTVYDLVDGGETARVLLRTQTSHAFVEGGGLFFGETGVTRFDDKIRLAPAKQASAIDLPARELPGSPKWFRPGTDVIPVKASAPDKIRLYARPNASGSLGIQGGRFAATYFRIALGLDATSGAVAWAHATGADILGGAAYAGGFALCDASGKVTFVDAKTGGVAGEASLGRRVDTCIVHTDGLKKPAAPARGRLAEQLAKVVMMPESEHAMMQKLLLREMSGLEDEFVTKALIDLASAPLTPPILLEDARKSLAARRNGVSYMLEALGKHYDFLADVLRPPPVGPLADALAALNEKRAAPLLAAHLNDPADTPDDAQRAAAALAVLADKGEVPALTTFFAHYRGAAEDDVIATAVVSTAQALVRLGAADVVAKASTDAHTLDAIKSRIMGMNKAKPGPTEGPKPGPDAPKGSNGKPGETKAAGTPPGPKPLQKAPPPGQSPP